MVACLSVRGACRCSAMLVSSKHISLGKGSKYVRGLRADPGRDGGSDHRGCPRRRGTAGIAVARLPADSRDVAPGCAASRRIFHDCGDGLEGIRGQLEIGAGTIVRSDGITVLLDSDVPPELQPAELLDEHDGLRIKLLRRPGRAWIALTALRSTDRPRDTELELLLGNTVRRLTKRLRRRGFHAEPLELDELSDVLATLTPKHLTEEWDALVVGGGRFRMYVVPSQFALQQAGAIAVTTCSDLDHALVLAPADAPPAPGAVPQTGRHRFAFVTALP